MQGAGWASPIAPQGLRASPASGQQAPVSAYGWDEMASLLQAGSPCFQGRYGASPCALGTRRKIELGVPLPCWKGMSFS